MSNDHKKYWFRAKRYGWGWGLPAAWQGWGILIGFIGLLILFSVFFNPAERWVSFIISVMIASALLLLVCYLKGEPPKWRWGRSDDEREG